MESEAFKERVERELAGIVWAIDNWANDKLSTNELLTKINFSADGIRAILLVGDK